MKCNIPSVNYTLRSVRALNDPYGSNGSLSILTPSQSKTMFLFLSLPDEMQYTIRELNSTERKGTLRSVRMERTEYAFNGSLQCGCIGQRVLVASEGGGCVMGGSPNPLLKKEKRGYFTQGLLITKCIFFNDRK